MVFNKYTYPLPNNGSDYSFSEPELIKLLDSVYEKGFKDGVASTIQPETTCISTSENLVVGLSNDIKCPRCGESYYTEEFSTTTCLYYPPIYKDGVNINPDRNQTTRHYRCLNCQKEFTI